MIATKANLADAQRRCLEGLIELSLGANNEVAAHKHADALRSLAQKTKLPTVCTAADLADVALGRSAGAERLVTELEAEGQMFAAAQAHLYFSASTRDRDYHLNRAHDLFTSMGANLWIARVSSQARTLGFSLAQGRRKRARKHDRAPLTPTEVQLAQLLRQRLTNRQISHVMHYSTKTIEVYVSRLYQKVGCRSRLELVMAIERGEIDLPSLQDGLTGQARRDRAPAQTTAGSPSRRAAVSNRNRHPERWRVTARGRSARDSTTAIFLGEFLHCWGPALPFPAVATTESA